MLYKTTNKQEKQEARDTLLLLLLPAFWLVNSDLRFNLSHFSFDLQPPLQ